LVVNYPIYLLSARRNGFDIEPLGNGWLLWLAPEIAGITSDLSSFAARKTAPRST
jgi:hypothetical protein